jgi:hypothetical protein
MSRRAKRRAAKKAAEAAAASDVPTAPTTSTTSITEIAAKPLLFRKFDQNNSETDLTISFKGVDESLLEYYQSLRGDLVNQVVTGEITLEDATLQFSEVVAEVLVDNKVVSNIEEVSLLVNSLLKPVINVSTKDETKSTTTTAYTGIRQASTERMGRRKTKQQVYLEEKAAQESKDLAKAKRESELLNKKLAKKTARRKKI